MKEYIFTYDALKKIKDSGGKLSWDNISEEQLRYLFIEEDCLSSQIAELYDTTTTKVSYKRKKYNIMQNHLVSKLLINDQKEFLKKYINLITQKEIDEFIEIQEFISSRFKRNNPAYNIELPQKYKDAINNNKRMTEIISESFLLQPRKNSSISLKELKKILKSNYNIIEQIENDIGNKPWLELYYKDENILHYSSLVPNEKIEACFYDVKFDIKTFDVQNLYSQGKNIEILGTERNPKSIVLIRDFLNIKPSYLEILEEFRLFHHLFYDRKRNNYYKIYENGNEEEIIIIDDNKVTVKLKYLKEFLTYKEMSLLFFFDIKKNTDNFLKDSMYLNETYSFNDFMFNVIVKEDNNDENKCLIRYYGKKLIRGFLDQEKIPKINHYFDGNYVDFIVDVDKFAKPLEFSCNPDKLIYNAVHNVGITFNTKVYFKREVLSKYYREYEKYLVTKEALRCGNFWELPFESINRNYIVIELGNIGKILNYEEQLYWKCYNIPPDWIYNENIEEIIPQDFLFLDTFRSFQSKWIKKHNWFLFKPLSFNDEYHLKTIHIPFADNQNEFDEQVRSLVKIIIDSINEKEIKKIIKRPEIKGSISLLECYFKELKFVNYDKHIFFLRKLQTLRSVGIAHRKSSKYEEISRYFKTDEKTLQDVFSDILCKIVSLIKYIDTSHQR